VFVQLAITTCGVLAVVTDPSLARFFRKHFYLMYIALAITIALSCCMVCFKKCARQVPMNYCCLLLLTIAMTVLAMTVSGFYNPATVLLCMTMTVSMVAGIILLGCCIKGDMFWCYGILAATVMGTWPLVYFNYLGMIKEKGGWFGSVFAQNLLGYVFVTLAAVYIVYDVDSITSRDGISVDDYILGALFLFTDIINLFMCILQCFGGGG